MFRNIENRIYGDEKHLHYDIVTKEEDDIKEALQKFEEDYPDTLNKDNINDIIRNIMNDDTEIETEDIEQQENNCDGGDWDDWNDFEA